MCDTMVALGTETADGAALFGKNSDRHPNEPQAIVWVPPSGHDPDEEVRCTYISVPQVPSTHGVLMSKPFWIWGCEMGVNDQGVAIGNEAVFTRGKKAEIGLLGMDLMRLALERADTASAAVHTIVELLERHGQGGNGAYRGRKLYYDNSYIVADTNEAWVLETADRNWAAEKVHGVRTISNGLSIKGASDLTSATLLRRDENRSRGSQRPSSFRQAYSEPIMTHFSHCKQRSDRSAHLLRSRVGHLSPQDVMTVLRDHGEGAPDRRFRPERSSMRSVCMHAANSLTRFSQTTGSMVAQLAPDGAMVWITGTSAPCLSVYKPMFVGASMPPSLGPMPTAEPNPEALWWQHEILHRRAIKDYARCYALIAEERDELERDFERSVSDHCGHAEQMGTHQRRAAEEALTERCFALSRQATKRWIASMEAVPDRHGVFSIYRHYWDSQNEGAGLVEKENAIV